MQVHTTNSIACRHSESVQSLIHLRFLSFRLVCHCLLLLTCRPSPAPLLSSARPTSPILLLVPPSPPSFQPLHPSHSPFVFTRLFSQFCLVIIFPPSCSEHWGRYHFRAGALAHSVYGTPSQFRTNTQILRSLYQNAHVPSRNWRMSTITSRVPQIARHDTKKSAVE